MCLKFKMGNYRTELSRSGESSRSDVTRVPWAEVNFLPNFPKGEDAMEVSKTERKLVLIERLMQTTFALCRKQIISGVSGNFHSFHLLNCICLVFFMSFTFIHLFNISYVSGLFACLQTCAEFHKITNINLKNRFCAKLDKRTPQLLVIYRQKAARTGRTAEPMIFW